MIKEILVKEVICYSNCNRHYYSIKFIILGVPRPKQSFRFTKTGFRYQTGKIKDEESSFKEQVIRQIPENFVPYNEAIYADYLFVFPYPKNFSKKNLKEAKEGKIFYKETKPDIVDNLNKGVSDAMQGIVFINDSRICKFSAMKIYGDIPRSEIIIKKLNNE